MQTHFDALIIGSGQAGPFLAVRLAAAGLKVALVEREHLGGTCVNDGCMPTKTLVASARVAHLARRAGDYGVNVGPSISIDMRAVKARKDLVVRNAVESLAQWLDGTSGLRVIRGHARFVAPNAIEVNGETLAAPRIFINVGARPMLPDWPGIADVPVLTNTSMMDLDVLPEHLIVIGASYIGLEFAQMFRRFGSRVTVLEYADRVIAREDEEISREVQAILEREGVRFLLGVREAIASRATGDASIRIALKAADVTHEVHGSHLLAAVGRRPNSDLLDLDRAGIATDARGFITVDDQLRTNVPGIWALGDLNGLGAFTHSWYNDHEIVAANLLDGEARRTTDRIATYALITDPPLGRVGMTEAQVRDSGRPALVGVMPMSRVGRAKERGETQGFMKVLVDAETERILGAALLCIEADEIVHSLLDVMAADASYQVIRRCVHIHPTVSELIPALLGSLMPLSDTH
jgi:pyruvate/2-oxoglutarate dehydrogenase complex dihydrolipoamide dehydrogenase (E3) component